MNYYQVVTKKEIKPERVCHNVIANTEDEARRAVNQVKPKDSEIVSVCKVCPADNSLVVSIRVVE